eukprot:g3334.t1
MELKDCAKAAKPKSKSKKRSTRRQKQEETSIKVPMRGGRRDRQVMKRDLTNTVLRNTAIELGERVGLQPRVLIMRLKAFDSIFAALKAFPKSREIAEACWAAFTMISQEPLGKVELRSAHVHTLERSLRKQKRHRQVKEWASVLERLKEINTYKSKR